MWLKQPHVEDVLDAGTCQKLETLGDVVDVPQHLERSSRTGTQLASSLGSRDCGVLWKRRNQTQSPTENFRSRWLVS